MITFRKVQSFGLRDFVLLLLAVILCCRGQTARTVSDEPIMVTQASLTPATTIADCLPKRTMSVRLHAFEASDGTEFVRQLVDMDVLTCWDDNYETREWQGVDNVVKCGEETVKAGLNTFRLDGSLCTAFLGRMSQVCKMPNPDTVVYTAKTPLAAFVPSAPEMTNLALTKGSDSSSIMASWDFSDSCFARSGFRIDWDLGSTTVGSHQDSYTIQNITDCDVNHVTVTVLDDRDDVDDSFKTDSVDMFYVPDDLITFDGFSRLNMTHVEAEWSARMENTCAFRLRGFELYYTAEGRTGPYDFIPLTESGLMEYTYYPEDGCNTVTYWDIQPIGPSNEPVNGSKNDTLTDPQGVFSQSSGWCVFSSWTLYGYYETITTDCKQRGGHPINTRQQYIDLARHAVSKLGNAAYILGLQQLSEIWTWTGDESFQSTNDSEVWAINAVLGNPSLDCAKSSSIYAPRLDTRACDETNIYELFKMFCITLF